MIDLSNIFRQILLSFSIIFGCTSYAQDIIIMQNGDEIEAKVLTIDESVVGYKKYGRESGPTYTVSKSKIFMIKYSDGYKDIFNDKFESPKESNALNGYVEKGAAVNNAELIAYHNPQVNFNLKQKNKKSKDIFAIMAVAPSSIMSNDDVEISFIRKCVPTDEHKWVYTIRYYIQISNKTNNIIYIDKGNSFKTVNNLSTSYYDSKQIGVSNNSGGGIGLGLGAIAGVMGVGGVVGQLANGVSVGGGQSSGTSTVYTQQRILSIPPHSSAFLSEYRFEKNVQISEAENFLLNDYSGPIINKGECREFDENTAPFTFGYFITYSSSPSFDSFSSISLSLFTKYIIGASLGSNDKNIYLSEKEMNKNISKKIINFETTPIIIGLTSRAKY